MEKNAYIVCCEPKVVLFGYATTTEIDKPSLTLTDARMVVYWSEETKGLLGLSSIGPQQGSRISPKTKNIKIKTKVECIIPCSDQAVKLFESGLWN